MNFRQIAEETRRICPEGFRLDCGMALRSFEREMSNINGSGWQELDLKVIGSENPGTIVNFYTRFHRALQLLGMELSNGEDWHDEPMWLGLTQVLSAFRGVLVGNFQTELPELQVRSMVDDMVNVGMLEQSTGMDGKQYVKLKTPTCDLRIRIIKIPAGPAPAEIRKQWVGLVLPAFKASPSQEELRSLFAGPDYAECYAVPIADGVKELGKVSQEGAEWFLQRFGGLGEFLFHLDEVEIVT